MTRPAVSFEFFPPKDLAGSFRLWDTVQTLAPLDPRFVSVTYGAGGTTRDLTRDAVATLHSHSGQRVAAHLTCVNASRDETLEIARGFAEAGVRDIVALRGDPPRGSTGFQPHPDGFASSVDLVAALSGVADFTIRVGAYPDIHPEATDARADIDWLKAKMDAGACEALTQFFFDTDRFLRFRDACAQAGITAPITPGILPVENWAGAYRFARRCGAHVPDHVAAMFDRAAREDQGDGRADLLAVAMATEMGSRLIAEGVEALHFYTLNRPELTRDICHALGITPRTQLQNVA